MRYFLSILFIFLFVSCATKNQATQEDLGLEITEVRPNKWTALTKQNLVHLFQVYELDPYLYTRKIRVQSRVIPHSHPVLTLNTRYAEHPNKLLASLLHEELHWFVGGENAKKTNKAIEELKKIYPQVPKEGGAKSTHSTYLHLIVCYLEYISIIHYLGEKEAKKMIEEMIKKDKVYPWIYTQVLYKNFAIKRVVHKYRLLPKALL